MWAYLCLFGCIWTYLGLSESIGSYMDLSKPIPEPCGLLPSTLVYPSRAGNIRVPADSCFCTRLVAAADRAFGAQRQSVGRGGASRRLRRGFGAGPQHGAIAMSLGCCSTPFWAIPGRLGLGFEVVELKFEVWGLGFKALGLGFGVLGLGLAVWVLGLAVLVLGFEVLGLGFEDLGLGFEVLGLGFEVLKLGPGI